MAVEGRFRHRGVRRVALFVLALAASLLPSISSALVVKTWNGVGTPAVVNDTAPGDDPGWDNFGVIRGGVYLGNQWVLTAKHAGVSRFQTSVGNFDLIPGTEVRLTNPTQFGSRSNLDTLSDVVLYRIGLDDATGMTPEELGMRKIDLANSLPSTADELLMIGKGFTRQINRDQFRPSGDPDPNGQWHFNYNATTDNYDPVFNTVVAEEHGFFRSTNQQPTWGTNKLANPSAVSASKSGNRILIESDGFSDTIGFTTRFDRGLDAQGNPITTDGSLPDEAQATANDSGGPVFVKENGEWVLAGVMHAIYFVDGESPNRVLFGSHTAISDLSDSHYRSQVYDELGSNQYSIAGDIDLDGSITGSIVNEQATGDLAVLVDNWGYRVPDGSEADLKSWVRGDLNQDGVTNIHDFTVLRGALGNTISQSQFLAIVPSASVPEPSTVGLLLMAGLAAGRRRR